MKLKRKLNEKRFDRMVDITFHIYLAFVAIFLFGVIGCGLIYLLQWLGALIFVGIIAAAISLWLWVTKDDS